MKMIFIFFLASISLIQSLLAVELSIYNSFTQIRQFHNGSGDLKYEFLNGELLDGSISWDGTPFVQQDVSNSIQSLKNVKVTLKRSTVCECETIEAKIIDPNSMLLQNLKTGSYFYTDKQSIEYTSTRPDQQGKTLTFQFQNKQFSGTLSYLVTGITWKPDYELFYTNNEDSKLRSYATINNNQEQSYSVENTSLFGGDIQLATDNSGSTHRFDAGKSSSTLESIKIGNEEKGLYSYTLDNKYTLQPSTSIRLPFININLKTQFYYQTLININNQQSQGIFTRHYDLTPDQFMPTGIVTVYDNHILIGQAYLPDVPKNYKQTITLGQDSDIRYVLNTNLTSKNVQNSTVLSETYDVDLQFINLKNKNVDAQVIFDGNYQVTLHQSTCETNQIGGNQLEFSAQLQKEEKTTLQI